MSDEWIVIRVVQGTTDEHQVVAFLNAHDIPTSVRGEALRTTHAFTLDGLGAVEVRVPPEHAEAARELLERVDDGDLELEADADADAEPDDA